MSIKLIADSTCDLSKELVEELDVDILPLHILLDEEEYKDGVDITAEEIYAYSDRTGKTPKTSAPNLADVINLLKKYKDEYDEIICFTISATMSSSFNVLVLASEELEIEDRVHVVNSKNLTNGIALLMYKAKKLIDEGKSAQEIVEVIKEERSKVKTSFILETLEYLSRGGRCNSITAIMGGAFKIHPCIHLEDGEMKVGKKYRGPFHKVSMHYLQDLKESLLKANKELVFIVHSGIEKEIEDEIYNFIKELDYFDRIVISRAGGVISSHCGPSTVGIAFMED